MREQILKLIYQNSKLLPEDLAAMLGVDADSIRKDIADMEEEGIICGYPTLVNWDNTESERVTALIEVKVAPERGVGFDKVAERIYRFDEVESVYLMSGSFDITVIIQGKSMKEIANFVSRKLAPMESVLSTGTCFVLKKYKEHGIPLVKIDDEDERMMITP